MKAGKQALFWPVGLLTRLTPLLPKSPPLIQREVRTSSSHCDAGRGAGSETICVQKKINYLTDRKLDLF